MGLWGGVCRRWERKNAHSLQQEEHLIFGSFAKNQVKLPEDVKKFTNFLSSENFKCHLSPLQLDFLHPPCIPSLSSFLPLTLLAYSFDQIKHIEGKII